MICSVSKRAFGGGTPRLVRRLCALVAVLCVLVAGPTLAVAEEEIAKPTTPAAQEHLTKGVRLYRLGDFEEAIKEYKAGALVEEAAIFYYNLGQSYRKLGNYDKAIWNYQRFLDRAKPLPAAYKVAVEGFIREMTAEKEQAARNTPPTGPAPGPNETPVSANSVASAPQVVTVVEPGEPWYADRVGWGIAATGVVSSSVAIWLVLDAKGLDDDADAQSSQAKQVELHDRADSRRLAGTIIGVAGGAALVAGIIKLAVTPSAREQPVKASSADIGVWRHGLAVMGRF